MNEFFNQILRVLNYQLFSLGQTPVTPLRLIVLIFLSGLLVYVSGQLRKLVVTRLLERTPLRHGARQAIGTILRYLMLLVGFVVILQTVGLDLTAFNVMAGAIGIGIGLGLQGIANNFISGLIILIERPIQVGDRIEIGQVTGRVVAIGSRATRVLTNDNIAIIIPNSKVVSENVVNWSYENQMVRLKVPIMVAHETDTRLVERLMLAAAAENKDILDMPAPVVRLVRMDPEGLYFELRVWSTERLHKPTTLKSDLTFAIVDKLRVNEIRLTRHEMPQDEQAGLSNGSLSKRQPDRRVDAEFPL